MRNLSPRWRTLKSEFLLRPADYVINTFDELERLLQDKVSVKDTVTESTLYLEQNLVTNGQHQNGKQGGKTGQKPNGGGGKKKGDDKPKTTDTKVKGAVVNSTTEFWLPFRFFFP